MIADDRSKYLQFVLTDTRYCGNNSFYTATDVLLTLEAEVIQKEETQAEGKQRTQKQIERLPVLEMLRKYGLGGEREHLLLAGKPGSGKSTTLRRLCVEMAETALGDNLQPIPVFVQLKGDKQIVKLIQAEFRRAKLKVPDEQIDDLLLEDKLVLLLDGVNEIPSEELRRELQDFRRFQSEILQYLAFTMLQGDTEKPTEAWLTLPRDRAEGIIEAWLKQRRETNPASKAKEWLEDLVEHHLLQVAADPQQIEFHHQLFQEYYAARQLRSMLQDKHPDLVDDERVKHFYLNYLKWTETLGLLLGLLDDEVQAKRLVGLGLEVDLVLGSRLSGQVKFGFQSVQYNCKFYNYHIFWSPPPLIQPLQIGSSMYNIAGDYIEGDKTQGDKIEGNKTENHFPNVTEVKIFERVGKYYQTPPQDSSS